jgi:3-oxoacyl-[acyl-carrier-protein] synthase II
MSIEPLTMVEPGRAAATPATSISATRRAVVTGAGLLTPLGRTSGETWDALLAGRFITDHARAAGEWDGSSPRVIQMARRAGAEAMAEAGWSEGDDFATVVGTSKGSIESWLPCANSTEMAGGLALSGLGDIAADLAVCGGPRLTLSGACASGLLALIRGAMLIESGQATRVLVVAAEASVHPLFLGSFQRLGVLPATGIGCRPFDELRDGFLMSECAAAVCLEGRTVGTTEAGSLAGRAGDNLAGVVVERYAQGADGSHLTSSDPSGRVLRHLVNKVVGNRPVDLVHAHGTGTLTNDPIELAAIGDVFVGAAKTPSLYSHKGALGHSLGAAGLVSVALNVLAHRHGAVPGNVRTTRPLPVRGVRIEQGRRSSAVHRSVALAAGFGGAMAAVALASA